MITEEKKYKRKLIAMASLVGIILIVGFTWVFFYVSVTVQYLREESYFEGQRDALTGDIRIAKNQNKWFWVKSPWNHSAQYSYNPETAGK